MELMVESGEPASGTLGSKLREGEGEAVFSLGHWVLMQEKSMGFLPDCLNILTVLTFIIIIWELGVKVAEGRETFRRSSGYHLCSDSEVLVWKCHFYFW